MKNPALVGENRNSSVLLPSTQDEASLMADAGCSTKLGIPVLPHWALVLHFIPWPMFIFCIQDGKVWCHMCCQGVWGRTVLYHCLYHTQYSIGCEIIGNRQEIKLPMTAMVLWNWHNDSAPPNSAVHFVEIANKTQSQVLYRSSWCTLLWIFQHEVKIIR